MENNTITLSDGRKLSVELNWNALATWTDLTGLPITAIDNISNIKGLRTLAYCGAAEGEKLNGRDFTMTEEEFGRFSTITTITEFVGILQAQGPKDDKKKGKKS